MATPRTPQDRKAPAKRAVKVVQRQSTEGEIETAAGRVRAASEAVVARKSGTAKKADAHPGTSSAALANEAGETPIEKPAGTPEFRALMSISRRERAGYLRALDVIMNRFRGNPDMGKLDSDDAAGSLHAKGTLLLVTADLAESAADIEDAMRIVAADQYAYEQWAAKASDEAMLNVFGWYQQAEQVGNL